MNKNNLITFAIFSVIFFHPLNINAEETADACYPDQFPFKDCVKVSKIEWNYDTSVKTIPLGEHGVVQVIGGMPPYTWTVDEGSISFDAEGLVKKIETVESYVTVYMDANACGTATINVTDTCSSVNGTVRSPKGAWVSVPVEQASATDVAATRCIWIGKPGYGCSGRSAARLEAVHGKYRYRQTYIWSFTGDSGKSSRKECLCNGVEQDWQQYADEIGSRHVMPDGEVQLINPFSGSQFIPEHYYWIWQSAYRSPSPPDFQRSSTGYGFSRHCYQSFDYFGKRQWQCATEAGTLHARGDDPDCISTRPTVEEWVCGEGN